MYTNKFIKVLKKSLCDNIFFINFENPIYCCQMIKNIFCPGTVTKKRGSENTQHTDCLQRTQASMFS